MSLWNSATSQIFGPQIAQRLASAADAAIRANLRTALQDGGYAYEIAPNETAGGLTDADLTFGFPVGAVERYGVTTASTAAENLANIQKALNVCSRVYSHFGWGNTYAISDYLLVPAGCTLERISLEASGNVTAYAPFGTAHQGQYLLLTGTHAKLRGVQWNGNGYVAGGVAAAATKHNNVEFCSFVNNGDAQAILHTGSSRYDVIGNWAEYCYQSCIQHWQCAYGRYQGNAVRVVAGGGLWGTDSEYMTIIGNVITDCGDVGLDMEGGRHCVTSGNVVANANNGELTWFKNGTGSGNVSLNCLFAGNALYRTAGYNSVYFTFTASVGGATSGTLTAAAPNGNYDVTFSDGETRTITVASGTAVTWSGALAADTITYATSTTEFVYSSSTLGALTVQSIDIGQTGIVFKENELYCGSTTGIYFQDLGANSCGIELRNNRVHGNAALYAIQRAYGLVAIGNFFHGLAGSESKEGLLKNPDGVIWRDNVYSYDLAKTTNYALHYYTDVAITSGPLISGNEFHNCGTFAFLHDPYSSGIPAILTRNTFSHGYETNGGIDATANGYPIFCDQRLKIQIPSGSAFNPSSLSALAGGIFSGRGRIACYAGGVQGATYETVYASNGPTLVSRDGSGANSGLPADGTRYATFASPDVTIATVSGVTAYGLWDLDLDTAH